MAYTKKERCIFRFQVGEKFIKADPQALFRRLMSVNADLIHDEKRANLLVGLVKQRREKNAERAKQGLPPTEEELPAMVVKEGLEATGRLIAAVRHAFKLPEFSGEDDQEQGVTDAEVFEIYNDFNRFMDETSKKPEPLQTGLPSTACQGQSVTANTSDCISIGDGNTNAQPCPC